MDLAIVLDTFENHCWFLAIQGVQQDQIRLLD